MSKYRMPTKELVQKDYAELIEAMARNSIFHSVTGSHFRAALPHLLNTSAAPTSLQPRIIFIVGAGASSAAAGLPGGLAAAQHLRKHLELPSRYIDDEIQNLSLQYNIDQEDFETTLLALSKFDRSYVLRKLRSIFGRRFHPWLGYELLAHFLKHRFVDAIINFNFDEILDQSLDDEVGENAFRKVVLDGDCPTEPRDLFDRSQGRLTVPLYVKPHGSASQPSSMRFTRDSYTTLPTGFRTLFNELLNREHPLHLVVIGHAMQSVEFNHMLRDAAQRRQRPMTFFFLREETKMSAFRERFPKETRFVFPQESLHLDATLKCLWTLAAERFVKPRPRGIKRHELVSELFRHRQIDNWENSGNPEDLHEQKDRLSRYFRDRTLVEIALASAKAKGFATLSDLANNRVGTYFRLYRTHTSKDRQKFRSLREACEELGLHIHGYGGQALTLAPLGVRDNQNLIVDRAGFEIEAEKLARAVLSHVKGGENPTLHQLLIETFSELYGGDEVEVNPGRTSLSTLLFDSAEVLPTLTALKLRTQELVLDAGKKWDTLLCTAKSGEWLLQPEYVQAFTRAKARLALVLADLSYVDALEEKYANRLLPIRSLPWWAHNQHVTVFLHGKHPSFAIWFERRLRSTSIAPLYLSEPNDVSAALDTFVAYWLKAQQYKADLEISAPQVENERNLLLNQLTMPFH